MIRLFPIASAAVFLLVLPAPAAGQLRPTPAPLTWDAAVTAATGSAVRILLRNNSGLRNASGVAEGTALRGDGSSIVLRTGRGETAVARDTVGELQVRAGRGRGRKILLGALWGTAIGAGGAAAGTLAARLHSEGGHDSKLVGVGIAVTAAVAGAGMAIAATLPVRYRTIYQTP
jgi:hypothetical protein